MGKHAENARKLHDHAFDLIVGMSQDEKQVTVQLLDQLIATDWLLQFEEVEPAMRLLTSLRGVVATSWHAAAPQPNPFMKETVK